jgi:hypothetical protein
MFEFKSQEVNSACLGHPHISKMPMIVSFVLDRQDTHLFIFCVLSYQYFRNVDAQRWSSHGNLHRGASFDPSFIDDQTAMPVLQAGA